MNEDYFPYIFILVISIGVSFLLGILSQNHSDYYVVIPKILLKDLKLEAIDNIQVK